MMVLESPPSGYRWSNVSPILLPERHPHILDREPPSWPRSFDTLWRPEEDRPEFQLRGTTKTVSRTMGHYSVVDIREITFRVLGSKERKANDWKDWRLCIRGIALSTHDPSLLLASSPNLMMIPTNHHQVLALNATGAGIQHVSARDVWGEFSFEDEEPIYQRVATHRRPLTVAKQKLLDRGFHLLKSFTTTMTLRGQPGSGEPEEQRHTDARQRLIEAGMRLQRRHMKIGLRELTGPLAVDSLYGVSYVLRVARWKLSDLKEELISLQAG